MTETLRRIRRWLAPSAPRPYSALRHKAMAQKAWYGVSAFYIVTVFFAYQAMYSLMDAYSGQVPGAIAIDPFWIIAFVDTNNLPFMTTALSLFFMGAAIAAALWPGSRLWRFLVCLALVQTTALKYSFGTINEKEQWWMWTAFVFIFLPNAKQAHVMGSLRLRQYYLDIFSLAQGLVLLIYSIVGFWKFYYGIFNWLHPGMQGMFASETLAYIASAQIVAHHVPSLMGDFLTHNVLLGDMSFIFISWIELVAILVWLRPSLHRLWGVLFILVHVGTWLFMNIVFYLQPPLLAILFLQSPFVRDEESWRDTLRHIPLFGWLLAPLVKEKHA